MRRSLILLLGSALMITGCASTAQGIRTSTMASTADVTLQQSAPAGTTLAIIRYPAFVEEDAEADFAAAYAGAALGGRGGSDDAGETQALANSMVLKSNYFAMSLYREMAARLPEHSVLLSPHRITLADDGSITSKPMTQAESLASVITVDFTAYSYPDPEAMMGSKPLSFGDLITPVVTVRTDPRTSVGTEGILLASSPLIDAAAGENYAQAITDARGLQNGRIEAGVPELDLISHISGTPRLDPPRSNFRQRRAGTVGDYPIEKIQLDGPTIATLDKDSGDVMETAFTDGFANQLITIINRVDPVKASMMRRADALSDYDESLAALTFVGADEQDFLTRLRYAERLLEAEQKYLSVQSLRLYDGFVSGEMGAQIRDIIREEYQVLEERRKLARQQNIATAAAIAAAIGGVAIASQDNDGRGPSYGQQLAAQAMLQGAIFSATEAMRRNRLSDAVGSNYLQAVIPALTAQTEIQVDLIDSNETITAIRFEDLKTQLGELYAENQRALDTVATRCAYTGASETGTWLGVCENGLANGSGVGVFRNDRGDLVEHYGFARNGRADGPGYRIIRGSNGSSSLEGNFADGEANGVMRVERSGSVALRSYRQGSDKGAAPTGSVYASPFRMGDRTG